MTTEDVRWMKKALRIAVKGRGTTSPNPMVGAIIVRDGKELGSGYHVRPGEPHAEINAIASCGKQSLKGATLYVTLEPCSSYGRTPPCTDAICAAGISRVVFGCLDPNPKHSGRCVPIFQKAGIEVTFPVCEVECVRLNEAFFKWVRTGRPLVLLKMAQTLDGRTATKNGCSKWITGEPARRRVQELRKQADAIMAGAETFRLDSPSFTVRSKTGEVLKTPRRIIVTNHPETFDKPGWEFVTLRGKAQWDEFLLRLGTENITSVLIEGGGELAASALAAHAVDRIEFHIAPKLLGGVHSRGSVGGPDPENLDGAYLLDSVEIRRYGKDYACCATVNYPETEE